jgi:outer membrane protein OmpA-like peptidoglycan-associated protein
MKKYFLTFAVIAGMFSAGLTGCATKAYVHKQIELLSNKNQGLSSEISTVRTEMEENIGKVWKEVEQTGKEISDLKETVVKQKEELEKKLTAAEEAIERSKANLKTRKLLYEVTISDESVFFAYKARELSKDAKLALNVFANVLLAENKDIFIEIQGHTDNVGSKDYNLKLGLARAEAVRNYLYTEHKIPLQRMSIFSYGESKPVVANNSDKNRSKNRRVVLMVME